MISPRPELRAQTRSQTISSRNDPTRSNPCPTNRGGPPKIDRCKSTEFPVVNPAILPTLPINLTLIQILFMMNPVTGWFPRFPSIWPHPGDPAGQWPLRAPPKVQQKWYGVSSYVWDVITLHTRDPESRNISTFQCAQAKALQEASEAHHRSQDAEMQAKVPAFGRVILRGRRTRLHE